MSAEANEDEWFDISEDMWVEPNTTPRKLKLCSDASVPQPIIDELRNAGLSVLTAYECNVATHADEAILAWSRRNGRVLLTMDRDFWDDRKFPLQVVPGVIFLDVPPDSVDEAMSAFGLMYGTFARTYSLEYWWGKKARVTPSRYFLKMRMPEGDVMHYEVKLEAGGLLARQLVRD